jgi:IMP cyclohydrolase
VRARWPWTQTTIPYQKHTATSSESIERSCGSLVIVQSREKKNTMPFEAYQHVSRTMPDMGYAEYPHPSFITPTSSTAGHQPELVSYQCELCDVSIMGDKSLQRHCKSTDHTSRVKLIQQMQKDPIKRKVGAMQARTDQLGLPQWRTAIMEERQFKKIKAEAKSSLSKFELLETTSLLQLVVWKAVCLMAGLPVSLPQSTTLVESQGSKTSTDISTSNSNCTTTICYHSWQDWMRQGWKQHKSSMRNANEIGIIMTAVLPFVKAASSTASTKTTTAPAAAAPAATANAPSTRSASAALGPVTRGLLRTSRPSDDFLNERVPRRRVRSRSSNDFLRAEDIIRNENDLCDSDDEHDSDLLLAWTSRDAN